MKILYYWAKFFKKLKGKAILNSFVHKSAKVEAGTEFINSSMNKHSFCGYNCEILNCEIGSFCSIANNVIIGGGIHPMEWVSMSPVFYEGRDSVKAKFSKHKRPLPLKTIIGNDVWIGENAMIKQGVTIGHGAVIGMNSVVTKNVDPYSIVVGSPAREIKKRFNDEIIAKMLEINWWNFEDNKLKELGYLFNNPEELFKYLGY